MVSEDVKVQSNFKRLQRINVVRHGIVKFVDDMGINGLSSTYCAVPCRTKYYWLVDCCAVQLIVGMGVFDHSIILSSVAIVCFIHHIHSTMSSRILFKKKIVQ